MSESAEAKLKKEALEKWQLVSTEADKLKGEIAWMLLASKLAQKEELTVYDG